MALKVKELKLWKGTIDDRAGGGARALEPLAKAGVNLEFVLARRTPEHPGKGVIFATPVQGAKAEAAARQAGLAEATDIFGLRVEGDNKAGVGHAITSAVAAAGVSFRGLSAATFGDRFVCFLALDSAADATKAVSALKKV